MKKDEQLEREINEYRDGVQKPVLDLSEAKREMKRGEAARRRRRNVLIPVLSSCAAVFFVFAIGIWGIRPLLRSLRGSDVAAPFEDEAVVYALSDAEFRSADRSSLAEDRAGVLDVFIPFEGATNATCLYTFYSYGGQDVLALAELTYTYEGTRVTAKIYTDLTGGKMAPQDFEGYSAMEYANGYRSQTQYVNGEYESKVYWYSDAARYGAVSSPTQEGTETMMRLLKK